VSSPMMKAYAWMRDRKRALQVRLTVQSAELGVMSASWNAFIGSDTAYFPRVVETSANGAPAERTLEAGEIMKQINTDLAKLALDEMDSAQLKALRDSYRESLDEVKEQTEYQDQKAGRLLTVVSIFAAIGGVIIGKFVEYFPPKAPFPLVDHTLVLASYAVFGLFLGTALTGAMVIFHASRTRYRYENRSAIAKDEVNSRLFYMPISKTTPAAWVTRFETYLPTKKRDQVGGARLQADYLRDCVLEAYLIACKANDKVRYLRPAQDLLSTSTKLFLTWLVVAGVTLGFVNKWAPPPPEPSKTSIQVTSQSSATIAQPQPPERATPQSGESATTP